MATVLDQFLQRRGLLDGLRFDEDRQRLGATLDWLEAQSETLPILNRLRSAVDAKSLVSEKQGFPRPPRTTTPTEVQAFGLFLMEGCRRGRSLHTLAHAYNIKPSYGASRGQEYVDEAMQRYIIPFIDFVQSELEARGEMTTPEQIMEDRFGLVQSPEFQQRFPRTLAALERIGQFCSSASAEGAWFNVGTSCREALNTFVDELRGHGLIDPTWDSTKGNTKGILKQLVAARVSDGRFGDALTALVTATWDYASSTLHRPATNKPEALRAYLWTALAITEMAQLLKLPERAE